MILTIKTADNSAEICLYDGKRLKQEKKWDAGYKLSEEILEKIEELVDKNFEALNGIAVFIGPGSFTGLRIGISVANTLAYAKNVPIVGENGDDWIEKGIDRIKNGENDKIIIPEYGSEANITKPSK